MAERRQYVMVVNWKAVKRIFSSAAVFDLNFNLNFTGILQHYVSVLGYSPSNQ